MKNKNFITGFAIAAISICFSTISTSKVFAQTKKSAKGSAVKNKLVSRKTSVKGTTTKARLSEAMIIGRKNPVLANPQTSSVSVMPASVSQTVSLGIINSRATNLMTPVYPSAAKAIRVSGTVNVQVMIDEKGDVISANAFSGHPVLRRAAERAALESKFYPTRISGQLVKVKGIIIYNVVDK